MPNVDPREELTDGATDQKPLIEQSVENAKPHWRAYVTVAVLFVINLLNFMDRFTISAVLVDIQEYFTIDNSEAGLIHTSFIVTFMILSPGFGYMGDRYSRKIIIMGGILSWSAVTLAGSFVPKDKFWLFLLLRSCVGVGEASFSTTASTLIADMFIKDRRSNMLAIFYFALPVGSGLGYIVGARVASIFGDWKYALRVTPGIGVISVILVAIFLKEPKRGGIEGIMHLEPAKWCEDLRHLRQNMSFVTTVLGYTAMTFMGAALAFWMPTFLFNAIAANATHGVDRTSVSVRFGILMCVGGVFGIGLGSQSAKFFRRMSRRSDPLLCAWCLLISTPLLFFALFVSSYSPQATWALLTLTHIHICMVLPIVADIVLQVVLPMRRATGQAFQILFSNLLGGAASPFLMGLISDTVTRIKAEQGIIVTHFQGLQYALYSTTFVSALGGAAFLACVMFVREDKWKVERLSNVIFHRRPSCIRQQI